MGPLLPLPGSILYSSVGLVTANELRYLFDSWTGSNFIPQMRGFQFAVFRVAENEVHADTVFSPSSYLRIQGQGPFRGRLGLVSQCDSNDRTYIPPFLGEYIQALHTDISYFVHYGSATRKEICDQAMQRLTIYNPGVRRLASQEPSPPILFLRENGRTFTRIGRRCGFLQAYLLSRIRTCLNALFA